MSSQQIPQGVRLKFAEKHIRPILNGEKTVTFRLGLDSNDYPEGSPVLLCDEDGDWFAEAEVVDRGYTTAEMAAMMEFDGLQNDGLAAPIERLASNTLKCEPTPQGPRSVGEEFETLVYPLGDGWLQTTLAFWNQILEKRAD